MDGRKTTDNSVLKSHLSSFLHPGEQQSINPLLPRITGWTHQPSTPSLEAAACLKVVAALGRDSWGGMWNSYCAHTSALEQHPKSQLRSTPRSPLLCKQALSTCSES